MDKDELLAAAERMNLSLDNLASVLGVHRSTMFRYAKGETPISRRTEFMIQTLEQQYRAGKGVVPPMPDGAPLKPQKKRRR